jgi:hypothetical protein
MNKEKIEQLGGIRNDGLTGRTITADDVLRVEQHVGSRLPDDYRSFLLQYGSGQAYFDSVGFPIETYPGGACGINAFIGAVPLENSYCYDLISHYEQTRGDLPKNLLPIADDGAGNYVCLSVAGKDAGCIYFWNHEEVMEAEDEPTYKYVELVAQSFSGFINKLQIYNWE